MATESRRPFHLAWFVALSASIYAVNLAAVSAMQAGSDATVAAQQIPTQVTLDALKAHDAKVAQDVERAATSLQAGAAQYAQAGKNLAALELRLAGLGKSANALRALPAVPNISGGGGGAAAIPVVHTTTGASGAKP